ncbi:MAG: AraC family transcriptional regulator [Bacteroidales bacterium]|nr:AraC family transcriptional regulator [Bacteroidales bacterium]
MNEIENSMYYLSHLERDEQWGIVCTTVGSQSCGPDEKYPVNTHPSAYSFSRTGRVLDEYQLVYITSGQGWFKSDSTKLLRVCEGNMIIIFPGETHMYYPDEDSGWNEMWVGFKGGKELDRTIGSFFDRNSPILNIGISDTVCDIYGRLLSLASSERLATQQAICGFVHALLGYVYYKVANSSISGNKNLSKIQHAQMLLRAGATSGISPADVASKLGMSYSLLREQFKLLTGISMSDYIIRQKINLAKTLLTSSDKSIKEIAFETGYESISRFCCSFSQNVGMTASAFRKRNRH